jgi:hypothetical protein
LVILFFAFVGDGQKGIGLMKTGFMMKENRLSQAILRLLLPLRILLLRVEGRVLMGKGGYTSEEEELRFAPPG